MGLGGPDYPHVLGKSLFAEINATFLNAIFLNRGSIYGHPTWKQIRGYQHPLVRYWRKNNDYNFPEYDSLSNTAFGKHLGSLHFKRFKHFTEPPVSSKYKPLVHKMSTATKKTLVATHTYANNLAFFTNQNLIDELNKEFTFYNRQNARKEQYYENLKSIYIDNEIEVLSDLHYKKNHNRNNYIFLKNYCYLLFFLH